MLFMMASSAEMDLDVKSDKAVVIPIMLSSMKKDLLFKQLLRRGREKDERQTSRYKDNLEGIWELQSWLLGEADKAGITIIENWHIEETVRSALDLVIGELMKHFPPHSDDSVWET